MSRFVKLMHRRTVQLVALGVLFIIAAAPTQRRATPRKSAHPQKARHKAPQPAPIVLPCGDVLAFQILLDRAGFSPGQLSDKPGPNFTRALTAMQSVRAIPMTGEPDCDTWHALGGDRAGDLLADYTIGEDDLKGPFTPRIPPNLVEQASLTALSYRGPLERLGEKFHISPAILQHLNARTKIAAGATIKVPAVQPFDPDAKPVPDPANADVALVVSREDSALRAQRADGTFVFFAPVTTGSEHDPLPVGDWKVKGVKWYPKFHYNPRLFWDAKPDDGKATLPPGPNSPVGVVWIDLNLEHYGLHGTPEPGNVGHTESHGCVRLTNWDAARVAALVKPGTSVRFQ